MNEGARAVAVLAAALLIVGCMPTLGFLSGEGVVLALLASMLATAAVFAPERCERALGREWAIRALRVVGPVGLVIAAYRDALAAQPQPLGPYLGLIGFAALVVGMLRRADEETPLGALLPGVVLWCAGAGLLYTKLMYVENPAGITAVSLGWIGAVVLAAVMMFVPLGRSRPAGVVLLVVLLALGGLVRGGAIVASPRPVIDVYSVLDQTPKALLRGENPYRYRIVSPYGTERARRFRVGTQAAQTNVEIYPPGIILLAAPLVAAGADPRWLLVACWLAVGLLVAWRAGRDPTLRRYAPHLVGMLMLLPSASFTAEQSWIDPAYLAPFLLGMAVLHPVAAGLLLGLGLTVKQTAVCVLPAVLIHCRRSRRALAAAAVAFAAVMVPFLLWDPGEMLRDLVLGFAGKSVHANALSLPGLVLATTGYALPAQPLMVLALGLGVLASWRARGSVARLIAAAGLTVAVFSLLSKYAYLNWYEGACLLLLSAAAWTDPEGPEPGP